MTRSSQTEKSHFSPLSSGLAFRPFFWLGTTFGVFSLIMWLFFWQGLPSLQPYGGMVWWHQHEMLFGFVAAIIVGFLLTAVQSWTGLPSVKGGPLWLLVLLWALGRLLLAYSFELPVQIPLIVDGLFLPVVALIMARLVIRAKKWRNLIFFPILLWLSLANLAMHWGHLSQQPQLTQKSAYLTVWLIVSLIVVIAGRVIPFFTSRALSITIQTMAAWQEKTLIASALITNLFLTVRLLGMSIPAWLFSLPVALIALLSFKRLLHWQLGRCWGHPLLWGLQLSYAFIVLGALLWIASEFELITTDLALHTLTIGAIMGAILAMIARVSLGHTGRAITALPGLTLALLLIFGAALLRGVSLLFLSSHTLLIYKGSLLFGSMAFIWFLISYTRILWSPRVDQRPG